MSNKFDSACLNEMINRLENHPGVYTFCNEFEYPLYIGKSRHVKKRIISHIREAQHSVKKLKLIQQTANIICESMAGDYTALFREAELVKTYFPLYNRQLRRLKKYITLKLTQDNKVEYASFIDLNCLATHYGIFKNLYEAKYTLEAICDKKAICKKMCGLTSISPCFRSQLGKCRAVCTESDYSFRHGDVLNQSLQELQLKQWPYPGRIAIKESNLKTGLTQYIILYRWCYLGVVQDLVETDKLIESGRKMTFDRDYYYLALRTIRSISSENIILIDN